MPTVVADFAIAVTPPSDVASTTAGDRAVAMTSPGWGPPRDVAPPSGVATSVRAEHTLRLATSR